MLEQLGRWTHRRRTAVLALWAALVVAGLVLGGAVFENAQEPGDRPGVESTLVEERLDGVDPSGETVVAVLSGADALGVTLVGEASRILYELRDLPGVAELRDPYTSGAADLVADDGQGAVVEVELDPALEDDDALDVADRVTERLRTLPFPTVLVGGELYAEKAFADQAMRDAAKGEGIALVLLLVVLVVALGGWLVGSLPVATALAAVAGSLLSLTGLAAVTTVSEYAVNVVTVLGLGLSVDYGLLVVARFREERAAAGSRGDPEQVLGRVVATAGRTVLVSGLTVGTALAGLLVLGDPVLTGMAVGGVVAVAVATLAGLTLTPALVAVAGGRIPAPDVRRGTRRPRPAGRSLLARQAAFAQARPWPVLLGATALLLLLAAPLLSLEVGSSDTRSLPADSEPRLAQETIERDHTETSTAFVTVLADPPPEDPRVGELARALRGLDDVRDVTIWDPLADGTSQLIVEPAGAVAGPAAQGVVEEIRSRDLGLPVLVGGPAAQLVDARGEMADRLPFAILLVALVTGLLLLALTGSVVVPLKTLVLNLLSLGATLGVTVAVFQWGWGSSLLGFSSWGALDITTPLLLFMFAFGLSMDYHVFLVARIREAWQHPPRGRDAPAPGSRAANDRAVLAGITSSGPVVTLAAVAIAIVFVGFASGELVAVKEIGIGMTVAVLLDVTVVRGLLLPAAMTLLGQWNWWPGLGRPRPSYGGEQATGRRPRTVERSPAGR
ncbi:MMPL family transporter [Nocardioides lianchengensis]|uniref:Putative drug exporter of the RND superfamily n=1 Tax=Nocardioides lianchengensis TaxID=1045774 RepID=A0A1G7A909_9ACTN|nr:MMPL family transporter [Nocardioides lianchengensis]NYG13666.1 RND superfamily putative drug exporter [Nocardioides lianchengensis]SDE11428.1 putative drug exporter of the RND superfamily [Nocardioides lianchengensis]